MNRSKAAGMFQTVVHDGSVVRGTAIRPPARVAAPPKERAETVTVEAATPVEATATTLQALTHLQGLARELLGLAGKLDFNLGLATHLTQITQSPETMRQVQLFHQARLAQRMMAGGQPDPSEVGPDAGDNGHAAHTQAATELVHTLLPLVAAATGKPESSLPVRTFVSMVAGMLEHGAAGQ